MKKIICMALALLSLTAFAQEEQEKSNPIKNALNRFNDPEKGSVVFIEKGHRSLGISGGFRSFQVGGEQNGDGYAILSLLNIGNGSLYTYNVSPSFSYFLANDLSLGVRFDYSGYQLKTDLKIDLRDLLSDLVDLPEANFQISSREMISNSWGGSLALRKYLSFFGSKTFGVFGEARLYGKYSRVTSTKLIDKDADGNPLENAPQPDPDRMRISDAYGVGLKLAAGACLKLKDNSAITVSIPIVGAGYSYTKQFKTRSGNTAHMSQFNISRDIDFMAIQIGYTHYIKSKKNK